MTSMRMPKADVTGRMERVRALMIMRNEPSIL